MFEIYKINDGDTIDSIAVNHRTTSSEIFKINGFECDRSVRVGEDIIVPKLTSNYFNYYTIREGMSLSQFSKKNNMDCNLISNLNGLNCSDYLYPGQVILTPKENVSFYITQDNDTLNDVCNIMKTNVGNIVNQNNKLYLREGQLIVYKEK